MTYKEIDIILPKIFVYSLHAVLQKGEEHSMQVEEEGKGVITCEIYNSKTGLLY